MGEEGEEVQYTVQYLDGPKEQANWVAREGRVVIQYANGDKFEGRVDAQRRKNGEGTYTWVHEEGGVSKYTGNYVDGKKEGYGEMTYANGNCYRGLWKDDKRNGHGSVTYHNKDTFSGDFLDDKKHGAGVYVFHKPYSQIVGTWGDDVLKTGKWIHQDMTTYHGKFADGKPIDQGVFVHYNGLCQEGKYDDGSERKEGDEEEVNDEENEEGEPKPRFWIGGKISTGAPIESAEDSRVEGTEQEGEGEDEDFVLVVKKKAPAVECKEKGLVGEPSQVVFDEIDALRKLFDTCDANDDGNIDLKELTSTLEAQSEEFEILLQGAPNFIAEDIVSSFTSLDKDGNGTISKEEFEQYFYVAKLFHISDKDGSGEVVAGELRTALITHGDLFPAGFGEANSRIAVSALISAGDSNDDRKLCFSEFLNLIMSLSEDEEQQQEEQA